MSNLLTRANTAIVEVQHINNGVVFFIGQKHIANISPDLSHSGRFAGRVGNIAHSNSLRYVDCFEFVTDAIQEQLQVWGLNVEFTS